MNQNTNPVFCGAFSLVEILIGLIIISIALTAFAPVMSKKVRAQNTALDSKLTENCPWAKCNLCKGTSFCVQCGEECPAGKKLRVRDCNCIDD